MSDTEDLIRKIQKLSIHQKQIVINLVEDLSTKENQFQSTERVTTSQDKSKPPSNTTSNGVKLSTGDKVCILNNRKTGKAGDIVTIIKFNKKYIALQLDRHGSYTHRDHKYLEHIGDH